MNDTDAGDYKIGLDEPVQSARKAKANDSKSTTSGGPTFGVPAKLEPFILLGKNARGGAAANLIAQATAAPGVYVFSELLALPGVKDLATNEQHKSAYDLLELFAYGTWTDYEAKRDSLPALNPAQETKLKQLSILSLASTSRTIPYSLLLSTLSLPSIPALEDLLIESFYSNLLTGRLDQKHSQLQVLTGLGRDVRPTSPLPTASTSTSTSEAMDLDLPSPPPPAGGGGAHSVPSLTSTLSTWLSTISTLLSSLDTQLHTLAHAAAQALVDKEEADEEMHRVLGEVQSAKEKPGPGAGGERKGRSAAAAVSGRGGEGDGEGEGGSWSAGVGKMLGLGGKDKERDEMDVDAPGGSGGRGESGPRTRKRGRR